VDELPMRSVRFTTRYAQPHCSSAALEAQPCFHCGRPLSSVSWPVEIDGAREDTCCPGCQAVAQLIAAGGLGAYYRQRSSYAERPRLADDEFARLALYDDPEVQRTFVSRPVAGPGEKEAALLLEGLTCGACVWLIEQRLALLEGITGVTINYATRRARIRWDDARIRLSAVLRALADLGYAAQPYDPARAEAALAREQRLLLWRLALAAAGMMYAAPAYVSPDAMSADHAQLMRIASLVLTAPVALWAALPFYVGALREIRTRSLGMDTPVSLGIIVGFVASAYATWSGTGAVYFDTVAMFVFLLLGGRYLRGLRISPITSAQAARTAMRSRTPSSNTCGRSRNARRSSR
jgi:P-type Cu2+ transporter